MKARDPYHLAVTALADFAGEGRFGWGRPLVVTSLAVELGLSPTPVREALARLAGEGVLEHRPGRGYFAPSPTASDIVELYEMHRRLVGWAIDLIPPGARRAPIVAPSALPGEAVFAGLVAMAGHEVLNRAYRRTAFQLRPIRRVERDLDPAVDAQMGRHEQLLIRRDLVALRQAIEVYHNERMEAAQRVFAVLRRSGESIDRI